MWSISIASHCIADPILVGLYGDFASEPSRRFDVRHDA